MLCNTELSKVSVVEEDEGLNLVIEDQDAMERLTSAVTYGDLNLVGVAGRALLAADSIPKISSGSVIVLEQSPDEPASVLIPEIDYVVCRGRDRDGRRILRHPHHG